MMMLMSLTVLIFFPCVMLVGAGTCPKGFLRHKNSCYWFSAIKGSFAEASATCQYLDSKLASVTSEDEYGYIKGYIDRHGKGPYYYLGGSDLRHEGTWTWEKPTRKFTFTKWHRGEPNNVKGKDGTEEHCLTIYKGPSIGWYDSSCHDQAFFVCKTRT